MGSVEVRREGVWIDGKPLYLLAGCLHYFRYPCAEWRSLLAQACAAGLNTIDTVIPWNRHEPEPGVFDFGAEADLGAFLDLCAELGLYAIVRPGPYICAEWENGGIPAWLTAKADGHLRTDDPGYLQPLRAWFDTLLPIIVPRQYTHGGAVILCQIENEHWASGHYGSDFHQATLAQAAIERGVDVPQYTCMGATRDWPEFRNGWSGIAEKLVQTRALWPDNPMIVSELWSGWFDNWGSSRHTQKSAARLDMTLHQLTAVGASGLSHWVWAGGTNFGFWGGRTVGGDTIHMTTTYDYDAPVSEYGETRAKFFVARRHHLFLATFGAELAAVLADAERAGLYVITPTAVPGRSEGGIAPYRNVRAAAGAPPHWRDFSATFLQNFSLEGQTQQIFLQQPTRRLAVEVEATSIKPIFTNLPLGTSDVLATRDGYIRIAFHTARILGFWPGAITDTLVCYGQPGEVGELGFEAMATTATLEVGDICTPHLAYTREAGRVIFTYWISEVPGEAWLTLNGHELHIVWLTTAQAARWHLPTQPDDPILTGRKLLQIELDTLAKPMGVAQLGAGVWQALRQPLTHDQLGCFYGYGWYRVIVLLTEALATTLVAPWINDRARLLVDGVDCGVFGVDPAGPCMSLPLTLAAGAHEIHLLTDNLGRFNYGSNLGEQKGLLDTLYWGGVQEDISTGWMALWQEAAFAGEAIAHVRPEAVRPDMVEVDLRCFPFQGPSVWLLRTIEAQDGLSYLLQLTGDRNAGELFINGVAVERFSRHHGGGLIKRDVRALLRPGTNVLALHINNYAGMPWRATLLAYDPTQAVRADWAFQAGCDPDEQVAVRPDQPRFYQVDFPRSLLGEAPRSIRLRLGGLRKGQIWLNGHNIGRYWAVGPQEEYKLPVSWLSEQNRLSIFEEERGNPEGLVALVDL